jgi:hypothetical protein
VLTYILNLFKLRIEEQMYTGKKNWLKYNLNRIIVKRIAIDGIFIMKNILG